MRNIQVGTVIQLERKGINIHMYTYAYFDMVMNLYVYISDVYMYEDIQVVIDIQLERKGIYMYMCHYICKFIRMCVSIYGKRYTYMYEKHSSMHRNST
jgi:hypothetical protein